MLVVPEFKMLSKFLSCCSTDFKSALKRQCSSSSSYGPRTAQHFVPTIVIAIGVQIVVFSNLSKYKNLSPSPELVPQSQKAPYQDAHGPVIATWFLIWWAKLTGVSSAQWEALRPPGLFPHCFVRPPCLFPKSVKDKPHRT